MARARKKKTDCSESSKEDPASNSEPKSKSTSEAKKSKRKQPLRTLVITDLTGDLCMEVYDEEYSKLFEKLSEEHDDGDAFATEVRKVIVNSEARKHLISEFFVQYPVLEKLSKTLEANRVIFLTEYR